MPHDGGGFLSEIVHALHEGAPLIVGGLFGALMDLARKPNLDWRTVMVGVPAGVATAYFVAPIIHDLFLKVTGMNVDYTLGVAFLVGHFWLPLLRMIEARMRRYGWKG